MSFFADIGLFMIDEVHILGDERGPAVRVAFLEGVAFLSCQMPPPACTHSRMPRSHTPRLQLEAVVSRLKLLSRLPSLVAAPLGRLRFVAVSATIPNVADVGAWIGAPPGYAPSFGDEYRACALDVKGARRPRCTLSGPAVQPL